MMRSNLRFARESTETLEIEPKFLQKQRLRPRRSRIVNQYGEVEVCEDPKVIFRNQFSFVILDQSIKSLKECFEQLTFFNLLFGFFWY